MFTNAKFHRKISLKSFPMDVDEHTEQVRQRALHLAAEVAETDDSNVPVLLLQLKGILSLYFVLVQS